MAILPSSIAAQKKLFSIVIPCFNEQEVIGETLKRLIELTEAIPQYETELIFVDDGSRDQTAEILIRAAKEDSRVKVISFARNFGHQLAVTAGVDASSGDAVVLIDADLQDPPQVILEMIDKWEEGNDVVYATRIEREGESAFKKGAARWFYRLLNRLSDVPIPLDTGDFRLMSRPVIDNLKQMPERDRFIRGMVSWVGFKQVSLPYRRAPRFAGTSKYPLIKMIRFAADGILSFSTKPLQLSIVLGLIAACLAMIGIVLVLAQRLMTNNWVEGWSALMIAVLFIGGVQLLSVGILGEYVGRIYNEVKRRPLYIIESKVGFREEAPPST
ncbi:MAG: glycosyltransferase [Bradymonadales bacterium]|nr:MAG: glycosyltransferase [Bradymonadales bacterium]